ncbi:MAG: sigma-70 family RNA polymerase sigma factor [Candidatus Methanosuratincola sp.]
MKKHSAYGPPRGEDDIERLLARELANDRHEPLDKDEVERLVRLAQQGNVAARQRVIETHLRLASKIARSYMGRSIPFLDLFQECVIALNMLIDRYDPYFGGRPDKVPFSAVSRIYMQHRIRLLIYKELHHPGRIHNPDTHDQWTGHNDQEIEKILKVREAHNAQIKPGKRQHFMGIRTALENLPTLHRKVVSLHFGVYDLYERSIDHISHVLAISQKETSQLLSQGLASIKAAVEPTLTRSTQRKIQSLLIPPNHNSHFDPSIFISPGKATAPLWTRKKPPSPV